MKKILYIVEDEKSAQFRYQVKNVAEAVNGDGRYEVVWFLKSEIEKARKCLDDFELVVIERQTAKDDVVLSFIKQVQEKGKKVLFSLDDLIFDYKDLPILMKSTNSKNVFYWAGYFWGIRRIAKRVDGFICTNEYLAKKLKRSFNKPTQVIPNSLNKKQVEVSEKYAKNKKWDGFKIGYFSGSPTHTKDFRLIEPELIKVLGKYDDATLRIVGRMDFSTEMRKWIDKKRVEVIGVVDYLKLQELVAGVDVNIAPLLVNDFTNCKSELKFFEAAVVETTTIASPTFAFKKAISDGDNGYLAKNDEWYKKIDYLYQHPKENRKVALAAKKYALKHYYGPDFRKQVEEAYDSFLNA